MRAVPFHIPVRRVASGQVGGLTGARQHAVLEVELQGAYAIVPTYRDAGAGAAARGHVDNEPRFEGGEQLELKLTPSNGA